MKSSCNCGSRCTLGRDLAVVIRHMASREAARCRRKLVTFLHLDDLAGRSAEDVVFGVFTTARSRFTWTVFDARHSFR